MPKLVLVEEIEKRLPQHLKIDKTTYVNTSLKCKFIDEEYGEFWAIPRNVIWNKTDHPVRGLAKQIKSKTLTIEEVVERLPDKIYILPCTYVNTKTKCCFVDEEYGPFWIQPSRLFSQKAQHYDRYLKFLRESHRVPIDEVKKILPYYLTIKEETYKGMEFPATFLDKEYGEYETTPRTIEKGGGLHVLRIEKENRGWGSRPIPIEILKRKLPPHITIDESTYVEGKIKARFIDKDYGEFWCTPYNVINKQVNHKSRSKYNKEVTCLRKYGVKHSGQSNEVIKKISKAINHIEFIKHWKTGQELSCRGAYEICTVKYLNEHKINFIWQIPFDNLDEGWTYYVDFYLIDEDKYVEIKGRWFPKALIKWNWFHAKYPNSEVWNEKILKEKNIYVSNYYYQKAKNV